MKKYEYVGKGAGKGGGVAGLPNVVTKAEAEKMGSDDILKAAIDNGNYKEVKKKATKPDSKEQ